MGIGFAIPINLVKQVMQSILKTGGVTRGWIGIEPQNLSHELINLMRLPKNTEGILVSAVLEGGPADRGGMNPKDIILEVNNVTVRDIGDLLNKVSELNPGDAVDFKLIRNSKELNLSFRIGKRPKQKT
ncbi:PDZ domain-containing protein [Polynucleobacter paneuropaeus]|jgi:serine protease DegQ|nr:PDZ domain-containing protein [Polynucleobacter paneuropaeus]